jgi:hypothetical protein
MQDLFFNLVLLLVCAIGGVIFLKKHMADLRKSSAINSILAKLALEKMDPTERQECYEATANITRNLKAYDVQGMPERKRLPLVAASLSMKNYPSPIDGESWRRGFASIDKAEKQIAYAVAYFKDHHGIDVSI